MGVTGILGGAFDPPHEGHVALAEAAKERFGLDRLLVLVAAAPGHKGVEAAAADRLALARAAFPDEDVRLDDHARTIDLLRDERFDDPLFLIGADEFCDFPDWKDPNGVLELTRLAVATRPGYPEGRIQSVLDRLDHPSGSSSSRSSRTRSPRAISASASGGVRPWTASSRRASQS